MSGGRVACSMQSGRGARECHEGVGLRSECAGQFRGRYEYIGPSADEQRHPFTGARRIWCARGVHTVGAGVLADGNTHTPPHTHTCMHATMCICQHVQIQLIDTQRAGPAHYNFCTITMQALGSSHLCWCCTQAANSFIVAAFPFPFQHAMGLGLAARHGGGQSAQHTLLLQPRCSVLSSRHGRASGGTQLRMGVLRVEIPRGFQ